MLATNLDHEDKLWPRLLGSEPVAFAIILFILQVEKQAQRGVGRPTGAGSPVHVFCGALSPQAGTHDTLALKAELPGRVRTPDEEVPKEEAPPWLGADVL